MANSDKAGSDKEKDEEKPSEAEGKIKRSLKSMLKQMELSNEEIQYRMENFENVDVKKEYMKLLKCTKCETNFKNSIKIGETVGTHPLLGVLMCDTCCDYYGDGNFSLDSEGEDKYCRWCGEGGTIFACSKCICGFCDECIKKHFGESGLEAVEKDDDWICYFCNPKPLWYLRSICSLANEAARNQRDQNDKDTKKKKRRKKERLYNDNNKTSDSGSDSNSSSGSRNSEKKVRTKRKRFLRMSSKIEETSSSEDEKENHVNSRRRSYRKKKDSSGSEEKSPRKKSKTEDDPDFESKKTNVLEKLTSIWKLTEILAEVGLKSSRAKLKSLAKPEDYGSLELLKKEHEELKLCMNVLVSSLSTASNSVSSIKEDLAVDTTKDERESFRSQELKLKTFADKFHEGSGGKGTVGSVGNSSRTRLGGGRGRRRSSDRSGGGENRSRSLFSDSECEREKVEVKEEKTEEALASGKESESVKPLLKVKSFARMLEANVYDQGKPVLINLSDTDESGNEPKKKKDSPGEKKESQVVNGRRKSDRQGKESKWKRKNSDSEQESRKRKGKGRRRRRNKSESDVETVSDASSEESGKSPRRGRKQEQKESSDEKTEKNTKEQSLEEKSEEKVETEKDDESKKLSVEEKSPEKEKSVAENEKKKSDEEKEKISDEEEIERKSGNEEVAMKSDNEEIAKKLDDEKKKKSDEEEKGKSDKEGEEKEKSDKESEEKEKSDKESEEKEKSDKEGEEKEKLDEEEKVTKSDEDENDKKSGEEEEKRDEEKSRKDKKSKSDSSGDESTSSEKKTKRKTRGQKKEVKASFEKLKRKRKLYLDSSKKESDRSEDEAKASKALESSESENEKKETEKKKKKRILVSSDEDGTEKKEEDESSEESETENQNEKKSDSEPWRGTSGGSSSDEDVEKKARKRVRRRKGSSDSSEEEEKKTKKAKRGGSSSDSSADEKEKKKKGRKNIKKILKKESLQVETKEALKNEEERKKRLKERQKQFEELFPENKEDEERKRLVLDFDPETKEPTVMVHKKLVKKLKPHQVRGVKFMWDSCFESAQKMEEESGSGCILAHCMGLGKTLQVVTLVHTVMTHDLGVNSVLVVCPLSTVSNWIREFETWLENIHTEPITLYDLVKYKKLEERRFHLKDWHENGGVLVISYDLFRTLTKGFGTKQKKRKTKSMEVFRMALLDPGPDLVVCDEGHLLKNEDTALSKCMSQVKTARRIVLTGTPLQNNLIEYHCMVQFVKPNILGTRKEFCNRFVNPINNGQFEDSTEFDVKIMKRRSHVLHSMLDGCIQRYDYSVLTPFLPEKHEYVLKISLTDTQAKAYMHFIDHLSAKSCGSSRATSLFQDYHSLQRIWTHPRTMLMQSEKETQKDMDRDSEGSLKDFVVSSGEESSRSESESDDSVQEVVPTRKRVLRSNANDPEVMKALEEEEKQEKRHWWDEYFSEKAYDDMRESNKLIILFSLLKHCWEQKDKVLVFSQSLYSLDLIEYFLSRIDESKEDDETLCGHRDTWVRGSDYFRLDGSTTSDLRANWCKYFNKESNTRARLFLISTKAGGLGINLYGANRVVIFDASWNPSHDLQSIFRVYRFGQKKTCYIYRFLSEATMEEKIYERQVTKLSLAHRVVDEHQIERHYTMGNLQELYTFQPTPKEMRKVPNLPKDSVLADILAQHKDLVVGYHEHDSLLENKQEEELSEEERKAAWKEYEEEKTMKNVNFNPMMMQTQQMLQSQMMLQGQLGMMQGQPTMMQGIPERFVVSGGRIQPVFANPGQNFINPMYNMGNNSNIPVDYLQRGIQVGLTPVRNETADCFLERIVNRETWLKAGKINNQAKATIESALGQSTISYQVVRRFILSKAFETPFGLQLLADMLNEIIQGRRDNTKEAKPEVKDEDETNEKPNPPDRETSDEDSSVSSCKSDSTVLYNMDASRAEKKVECDSQSPDDSAEKKKPDEEGKEKEPADPEDKELEKLLRMTDINPVTRGPPSAEGGEKEQKDKKNTKPKEQEVSLMDCLDSDVVANPSTFEETEEEKTVSDFFSSINNQIKMVFLQSSEEECESSDKNEAEEDEKKEEKKKNKKANESDGATKKRKTDLDEFRIPNLNDLEDEKTEEPKLSPKELSLDEDSDDSIQCLEHVKKQKRPKSGNKVPSSGSDSESNAPIHPKTELSPSKGRKNIKKILRKEHLQVETKQALKMEQERKRRLQERKKVFEKLFPGGETGSKLVLDFDPDTRKELVVVEDGLSRKLKPHQREGVRFMWDSCFESVKRLEEDSGSGCVLAHCMGLGKTLQVIALIHTVLTHDTGVKTALIMCPLNTIRNWIHEFRKWQKNCKRKVLPLDLIPCKSVWSRKLRLNTWTQKGGVLVISYEMFRSFIKKNGKILIEALLDPGPDLVVCDEGHVLKNSSTALSKSISQIKTLRRIVLTGTPMQNNLLEYYCMVQFVKPNILGTRKEFQNRFVNPINNGQFEDSTEYDVKVMKRRSHVLHTMLDGFIQRFSYHVLTPFLPEKQEYVISITLTETQKQIYQMLIKRCSEENRALLKDFHLMQKAWTHPRVLRIHSQGCNDVELCKNINEAECESIRSSGKLLLLFNILRLSKEIGDKVLVFSQSLSSLDLIEHFLRKANAEWSAGVQTEFADSWVLGEDYCRLDGSTNSENRDVYCQKFNKVENKRFRLLIVSTKAGGLGINLVAANRVVIFDASWNPTHDVQSIFRVYRFGQNKPCFIYRFLASATMEEKIYRRQVTKLSLAHRILDEHQIDRHYTMGSLQELYTYDPIPRSEWKIPKIPKDNLFADILVTWRDLIVGYHEHDSLLENKEEEELTEEERKAAWEDFEKEKLTPEMPRVMNGYHPLPFNGRMTNQGPRIVQQYMDNPVHDPNPQQMCRIVDVRTLNDVDRGGAQRSQLIQLGRSFGMNPFQHESLEAYLRRINDTLRNIYPWVLNKYQNNGNEV